jgi:fatty-acid desaturase
MYMFRENFYPREWFFIVMQLAAAVAFGWAVWNGSELSWWLWSLFGYFLITCLGITVTFHRLLTHKSYQLWKPLEYLFSFFGNIGCTGSSVGWVFVHKEHHRYADRAGDPHSPVTLGPVGAFVGDYGTEFDKWLVKEIVSDRFHQTIHKYYIPVVLGFTALMFAFGTMVAVHLFLIPVFFNTLASRFSNWIDHDPKFGYRVHETKDASHNVWWWSLLTFGEGWHNNHHARPGDYQIGKHWWQFDPGRYVIELLMLVGLAKPKQA